MKSRISIILLSLLLALVFSLVLVLPALANGGDVWYVDPSGTDDPSHGASPGTGAFQTIGYALSQATSGDTIYVAAGTYQENITLVNGVSVYGAGAGASIIDGGSNGPVVTANSITSATTLDGFTIQNGSGYENGGYYYGGGMYSDNSSPTVVDCLFSSNSAATYGGGIYNYNHSSPAIINCIFDGNSTGQGAGVANDGDSDPTLTNCTFYGNTASSTAHAVFCLNYSDATLTNCILWDGSGEIAADGYSSYTLNYCDSYGFAFPGTGNISQDPLFVGGGDFHLQGTSPCIDVGDNSAVPGGITTDFYGDPRIVDGNDDTTATVDMGAAEYSPPPPSEVWVDDDYYDGGANDGHTWGYDAFDNIQEGIDAVAGSTVHVAEGYYTENITLVDGVEVLGAGEGVSIIDGDGLDSVVTATGVGSSTVLDGFTITNGSAEYGGGMYNENASPTVSGCTFTGNNVTSSGGGMYNLDSSPTVSQCTFESNTADWGGGGMYNRNSEDHECAPTIIECDFLSNQAQYGGGMDNYHFDELGSTPLVESCYFLGNQATYGGGGIYNNNCGSPLVVNCVFSGNSATDATYGCGGGMFNSGSCSLATITNCTFYNNSAAATGDGMHNDWSTTPTVANCILWDGGTDEIYNDNGAAPTVSYCDIQGGYTGTGNINADPLFVDAGTGDFHLQTGSPCIDVGDNSAPSIPSTDFDGDPRIMDGDADGTATVDMGVDECLAQVWVDVGWADQGDVDVFNPDLIWQANAFAVIQDGIDAAVAGGTVHVRPGDYYEKNLIIDKSLTVESTSGDWHDTIIDPPAGPVFGFYSYDGDATISGFTLTNGQQGVYIEGLQSDASIAVSDCFIYNNETGIFAGDLVEGDLSIDNCIIAQNSGFSTHGIQMTVNGTEGATKTVSITNSVIGAYWDAGTATLYEGNAGDGIAIGMIEADGNVLIDNNIITENTGNGISDKINGCFGQLTIINNVIGAYDFDLTSEDGNVDGNGNDGIYVDYIGSPGAVTIEANTIINNLSSGITIDNVADGELLIHGNTIDSNQETASGIHINSATETSDVSISLNNIVDNVGDGVSYSYGGAGSILNLDATNNWWGDVSGPGGEGPGTGDEVSANVDYEPWLDVSVEDALAGIVTDGTLNNVETGTEVIVTGSATVTAAEYSDNPGGGFSGDIGKYIDVHVDDSSGVTEIEIRLYYTDADIAGLAETSLRLRWWNGTSWVVCSDSGVNTADITGPPAYSGYIWAKIRSDTTPTLAQLTGSVFGSGGEAAITQVPYSDTTAPYIFNVMTCYDGVTETTADICWGTSEQSTSQVEYGASPDILSPLDESYVNEHHVHLSGLTPATTYHYRTMSMDRAGNLAVSDTYTFTTLGEAPAAVFTSSDLAISPSEVAIGETVTISVLVTNSGDLAGSYELTLNINGAAEETRELTLEAGASQSVAFTVSRDEAGVYSVDIDGLSGSFTVEAPDTAQSAATEEDDSAATNWPLIGGVIAAAVVVIGLLVFFVARRRAI